MVLAPASFLLSLSFWLNELLTYSHTKEPGSSATETEFAMMSASLLATLAAICRTASAAAIARPRAQSAAPSQPPRESVDVGVILGSIAGTIAGLFLFFILMWLIFCFWVRCADGDDVMETPTAEADHRALSLPHVQLQARNIPQLMNLTKSKRSRVFVMVGRHAGTRG
ncbi:hypothetical protein QBC47DRAFT_385029 [Echria macrotheca]|uniref:Membrane-associated protein n=1 Tax=Echria macrotheca TaxID=438768 RepID=A0AAJ0BAS6_9PEZI|nr:hypothetical protein QBC47DRAFT_385029 [Echria macrotheca]